MMSIMIPTTTKPHMIKMLEMALMSIELFPPSTSYEIVVSVDKNPSPDLENMLMKYSPPVNTIIYNKIPEEITYAKNVNAGIKNSSGEYICLFSADAIATKHFFDYYLQQHKKLSKKYSNVGMLGTRITGCPQNAQDVSVNPIGGDVIFSPRLVAVTLFLRKSIWDDIGGYDEEFPSGNYVDDDLCRRLTHKGYMNFCLPNLILHHGQSFFGGLDTPGFNQDIRRGALYMEKKWGVGWKRKWIEQEEERAKEIFGKEVNGE